VANQLENIAYLAIDRNRPERAARLLGAAEAMRETADAAMAFDELPELAEFVERLRTMLPPAAFDAAWSAGGALSFAEAVAEARTV
jgi:hypothetical protein